MYVRNTGVRFALSCLALVAAATQAGAQQAIVIDHTCTDISQIPEYWIEQAREIAFHYARAETGEPAHRMTSR